MHEKSNIRIALPIHDENDDSGVETVWAEKVAEGRFAIKNVPFFSYGFSYGDEVSATKRDGRFYAHGVVGRSGHSTYRVFLSESTARGTVHRGGRGGWHLGI